MQNSNYNHINIEKDIYDYWEKNKFFRPKRNRKKYFSIVIPPPNVTGSLHMGHALNNSLQDLLVRFYRMNGYETLWQPGTDHAGIATQALVEKKLASENITKNVIGREKFIEKVWEWKKEYGDIIINQLKKLGCSCDWSRNAFTMDENLSKSVVKVFVELYKKKLIRLVEQYRMNNQIKFIDHCKDMALAYKVSDIVVSASIEPEAFGRVAVEAQSMEKPIIASNIGGSNETIIDEKTGFLYEAGNAKSLSDKILKTLNMDETLLKSIGNEGRKNIVQKFNVEKMCFSTYSEYKRLLN